MAQKFGTRRRLPQRETSSTADCLVGGILVRRAVCAYCWRVTTNTHTSQKSFLVTWLLAWFLGTLGIDRFYLGKIGTGVLKLITLGGFGIWAIIDLIIYLVGAGRDKSGQPLEGYEQHKKLAWIVTIVLFVLGIGFGGCSVTTLGDLQSDAMALGL